MSDVANFARAGEAYFSPDAKHIIFQAEEAGKNPFYQMFVMELASGRFWRVSPGIGRTTCGYFRPDGKKIIFASGHTTKQYDEDVKAELAKREEEKRTHQRRRYVWDHSGLDQARFRCTVRGGPLLLLWVVNAILIVITLGLARPWVRVRNIAFAFANLSLVGPVDLAAIQQEWSRASATGEGLAGLFDSDTGFDFG